jgi:hypothetical protein
MLSPEVPLPPPIPATPVPMPAPLPTPSPPPPTVVYEPIPPATGNKNKIFHYFYKI